MSAASAAHIIRHKTVDDAHMMEGDMQETEDACGPVKIAADDVPDQGPATPATSHKSKLPRQHAVEQFYSGIRVQIVVAVIIALNFFCNIVEKEIDPRGNKFTSVFKALELTFNILFTVELAVNMYAFWWTPFWQSAWNIFDVVVVTIGITTSADLLPRSLGMLRMMRAFRIFRLFKRVPALNKIIRAILRAIPGVMHAFLINIIAMCIYAILAVELFRLNGRGEEDGLCKVETSRGKCLGEEYFGTFSRSFYSMFQVLTGESWSEAISRPVSYYYEDDPILMLGTQLFFMSFILVNAIVLVNVVVAVLLDKMVDPEDNGGDSAAAPCSENPNVVAIERQLQTLSTELRADAAATKGELAEMKGQLSELLDSLQVRKGSVVL